MNHQTTPKRAVIYLTAIVAAIGSFVLSQGPALTNTNTAFIPRNVFAAIAMLIVVVVALSQLFGQNTPVSEGITVTHVAVAVVWVLYLLAGVGFVINGSTGWVVLGNLAIAVGVGIIFLISYAKQ